MGRFVGGLALVGALIAPLAPVSWAQPQTFCDAGQAPLFVSGFADLRARLGDWMGDPMTCQYVDPNGGGDLIQTTSKGLAAWRHDANTTMFTDGSHHWALNATGLVTWSGDSADPPDDAELTDGNPICATTNCAFVGQTAAPAAPAAPPPTYDTAKGPKTEQQLHDELASAGYGGPWDVPSMVAAYNQAVQGPPPEVAAPPSTPVPAASAPPKKDYTADCQAWADTLPDKVGNKILLRSNVVLGCASLANHDGAPGFTCFQAVLVKEVHDSIIYSREDFLSRYQDCLAGKPV